MIGDPCRWDPRSISRLDKHFTTAVNDTKATDINNYITEGIKFALSTSKAALAYNGNGKYFIKQEVITLNINLAQHWVLAGFSRRSARFKLHGSPVLQTGTHFSISK